MLVAKAPENKRGRFIFGTESLSETYALLTAKRTNSLRSDIMDAASGVVALAEVAVKKISLHITHDATNHLVPLSVKEAKLFGCNSSSP